VASIPSSAEQENYFRLVGVDDTERFVPDSLMENDRRFTLLHLRDQGVCGIFIIQTDITMHMMKSIFSP
jgi:hypothetical protein